MNRQNHPQGAEIMKALALLGAVGLGVVSGAWIIASRRRRSDTAVSLVNINIASEQDIIQMLGLDAMIAERIVEQRPYPNKIDLLGRMVVPGEIYDAIKARISCKAA
jgi:DNA uptake protein ComE-like DNA-binding protein